MSHIQAVNFNSNFWKSSEARTWLKHYGLTPLKKVHKTKNFLRYRIVDPRYFKRFITKKLPDEIEFIIGFKK